MGILVGTAPAQQKSGGQGAARFEYRQLRMSELPLLNDMYNAHYGYNRPLEEAVWLYGRNPCGEAVIHAAFDESGRLAGMRPSIPIKFWWNGEERMAYEFADALVERSYQGKGIFSRLVKAACDRAEQEGASVFSLPNENSLAVYRRNPALEVLERSHTCARPLAWISYLQHHMKPRQGRTSGGAHAAEAPSFVDDGDVCLRRIHRFESDFADVRAELQARIPSFGLRTREFLQWRYFGSPVRQYWVALIQERGQVRGYLVLRVVGGIAHVVDVFMRPDERLARKVFELARRSAKRMGAIGVHFSTAGSTFFSAAAAHSGFWLKKRSSSLVMDAAGTRRLAKSLHRPVTTADFYFAMGDFDFL
jgi:GNAT superfamily N-acetyltransferase